MGEKQMEGMNACLQLSLWLLYGRRVVSETETMGRNCREAHFGFVQGRTFSSQNCLNMKRMIFGASAFSVPVQRILNWRRCRQGTSLAPSHCR